MAYYTDYPLIDENKLNELAKRRFIFIRKNGMLFEFIKNNQSLIIVRKDYAPRLIKHFENRKIKTLMIKELYDKQFILVSYPGKDNALSLRKLCKKIQITKEPKTYAMLFKEGKNRKHYDAEPKTLI